MRKPSMNITPEAAWQWIEMATRREDVRDLLSLDDDQLVRLGWLLSRSPIINLNVTKAKEKQITFVCGCGCGEVITTTYKTIPPKYKKEHRFRVAMRSWARRRRLKIKAAKEREQLLKGM